MSPDNLHTWEFSSTSAYLWLLDVEITNTAVESPTPRYMAEGGSNPANLRHHSYWNEGDNNKIINCVVHDCAQGLALWSNGADPECYGNIVYYNGWYSDRPLARARHLRAGRVPVGHDLSREHLLRRGADDITVYSSDPTKMENMRFYGNVTFSENWMGWIMNPAETGSKGWALTKVNNAILDTNFNFASTHPGDPWIGYDAGGADPTIINNYFASENGYSIYPYGFTGSPVVGGTGNENTFIGLIDNNADVTYPTNTWLSWANRPVNNAVFVRANSYETGRANIIVYNWSGGTTVSNIDISGIGLVNGDHFEVRFAGNWSAGALSGLSNVEYSGQTITIPMTAGGACRCPTRSASRQTLPIPSTRRLRRLS